ncbi:MAG: BlaI/MecI/CopY family transcriptional regulator [Actinomycetota bacterium]|nr:BlaI/MecI/CopY family transcriptional regulator [Actinomycetota bacterium]
MTGSSVPRLGGLERRVMHHLWADASGERWFTVREVHEELAREREIAYTTVMTVLQRLAKKRLALEAREGRAYLYRATSSRGAVTADLMREALEGAGETDRATALTRFVDAASRTEVAVLRRALDNRIR